jgi:hypothetical protein
MPSTNPPHPEERPQGASRRTLSVDAANVSVMRAARRFDYSTVTLLARLRGWSDIGAFEHARCDRRGAAIGLRLLDHLVGAIEQ